VSLRCAPSWRRCFMTNACAKRVTFTEQIKINKMRRLLSEYGQGLTFSIIWKNSNYINIQA
ncbi:hypothetical protein ScPMuIL_006798, partial [Solemya velum]